MLQRGKTVLGWKEGEEEKSPLAPSRKYLHNPIHKWESELSYLFVCSYKGDPSN